MRTVVDRAVQTFLDLEINEVNEFLERTNLTHNNINQYVEAIRVFEEHKNKQTIVSKKQVMSVLNVSLSTVNKYMQKSLLTNVSETGTQPSFLMEQVLSIKKGVHTENIKQSVPSGTKSKTKKAHLTAG